MSSESINHYVSKILKGDTCIDVDLFKEVKEVIYAKYGNDFSYINTHIIAHIDREIKQLTKNSLNIKLSDNQMAIVCQFITDVLKDTKNPLAKYLADAIEQDSVISVWGDNGSQILTINGLIENIALKFKILDLIKEDEKRLLIKKRDKHKINDAIELLKTVSNDVHLLHHIENIQHEPIVTKSKILSSYFYHFTKILDMDFNLNKSQISKISNDIMTQVFESQKDYRIYSNKEEFRYKGFYLTRYIP